MMKAALFATMAIVIAVVLALFMLPGKDKPKPTQSDGVLRWHWPKVVISKETTYFTGPLRKDGGVDYTAAFNERYSKGVTPENNAAVAFWQAAGPNNIEKNNRKRYFELLGIAEPPEKGEYLTVYYESPEYKAAQQEPDQGLAFAKKIGVQHEEAMKAPWSKRDYPVLAAVLERNEKPLAILTEGFRRSQYYRPLTSVSYEETPLLTSVTVGSFSTHRSATSLLAQRTTLRLHNNDVRGAWQDILTLYRMARLCSQPTTADRYLAGTIENQANKSAVVFTRHANLTAAQARECQRELHSLPAMRPLWRNYDELERCFRIEYLMILAATKDAQKDFADIDLDMSLIGGTTDPKRSTRIKAFRKLIVRKDVDWTEVLRCYNAWQDRLVAAFQCEKPTEALARLKTLETDTRQQANKTADAVVSEKSNVIAKWDPKIKAQHIAKLWALPFVASPERFIVFEQRRQAEEYLTFLAFALAGYRADHHEYPKTLAELTPKYIDAIPQDPFTDGDLHYKSENGGYLVYSVGKNGKDNAGRDTEDYPKSTTSEQVSAWNWDDISIRTPPQKTK